MERASGLSLPGPLLLPLGLALLIVEAGLVTMRGATAQLAAPLAIALAIVGFGLRTRRPRARHLGDRSRGRGLRRLRRPDRPLRAGHVRRLHHARRHVDVAGAHRSGDGSRPYALRAGPLDLPAGARRLLRVGLSTRGVHAAWARRQAHRAGHRLAVPADARVLRRDARSLDLRRLCALDLLPSAPGVRRLSRSPAGAARFLCALERNQGARHGGDDRPPLRLTRHDDR